MGVTYLNPTVMGTIVVSVGHLTDRQTNRHRDRWAWYILSVATLNRNVIGATVVQAVHLTDTNSDRLSINLGH